MNDSKIVVAVAPVCHTNKTLPPGTENPLTATRIAEETIRCWRAGASLVHLHVRDETGEQVSDLNVFSETLDRIRDKSDIILQGSTGGVSSLTLDERCVCLGEPRVEMASLNMGSVNFGDSVYINTVADIRYWAGRFRATNTVPELEVFNPSMVETSLELRDQGVLDDPLLFNFALGFPGSLSADPGNLYYLSSMLGKGAHWGLVHEGMTDFRGLVTALGLGAGVLRVGFEDGAFLDRRNPATSNAELVERLVSLIRLAGFDVASPSEARNTLGLTEVS